MWGQKKRVYLLKFKKVYIKRWHSISMLSFKFLSLFSLFSGASTKVEAPFDVEKFFSTIEIEPPENTIAGDHLPYLELRRICFVHKDRNAHCPIRQKFTNALIETTSEEDIRFSEIKGCVSSKSGLTDFEQMRHHPKSTSNVNFHISAYSNRVEELAEKVLNGTVDCAVYKGRPAKIVRQEWDGVMWLANDGGSHRSAAVWHIDREQGRERLLPAARVTTNSLSPEFREFCNEHSVLLFKSSSMRDFNEARSNLKDEGILFFEQSDGFLSGVNRDYCVIIQKTNPQHDAVVNAMETAFNLSRWLNSLYASPSTGQNPIPELGLHLNR
jgi:hypothetical protein